MNIPDNLKYTKEHEWVLIDNENRITVGVTEYAQDALGDVVFMELPEKGETITKGESCGVVESVKAVSDIFAPASGDVIEINTDLRDHPEMVNQDCYGDAWMIKIEASNIDELDELLTPQQYKAYIEAEQA